MKAIELAPEGPAPILTARGIIKRFPGVQALDRVDFTVRSGEIHALMGENGAGKSTLFKILTGACTADGGEIRLGGWPLLPRSPRAAEAAGISTVYQEINLLPHLSVAENICLGRQPKRFGLINRKAMYHRARTALARLGVTIEVQRPLAFYSIALQQMTALARALDVDARVLILDEPTSSLDEPEVKELFHILRRLRDEGMAIVFVSHFLDQVYALSDRITVLRNGRLIGEFATAQLPRLELVQHMTGRPLAERSSSPAQPLAPVAPSEARPLLSLEGFGRRGVVAPVNLNVRAGEIIGLAGLLGSGRTELARLIFGLDRADSGLMRVNGRPVILRHPREALKLRFAFTPEDRKDAGIFPHLTVRENIVLALQSTCGLWSRLSRPKQNELALRFIQSLGIKTPDAETSVASLSGGNQQKVLLARWLATAPRFFILDEPTRGIDVGAKAEIERILAELRDRGMALLFISSELEEVERLSQRVVVLRDRAQVGELTGTAITLPAIFRLIAGSRGGPAA